MNKMLIAGGLGLFIFSLRIITSAIDESVSERIRKTIEKVTSKSYFCILVGVLVTLIFQASSTTILVAMGLLNRSLLTLEQGCLIMLGAALGTTLKTWLHLDLSTTIGTLLIIISSIGFLTRWQRARLQGMEIAIGIGFTILSLQLITSGLSPLLESPLLLKWLSSYRAGTFSEAMVAVFIGTFATVLVQSSSSVVALAISLASKNLISIEGASAIILGANIGTTSTALIVSIGQSNSAKKLAFIHFVAKAVGVLITLIFFKSFLALILLPFQKMAEGGEAVSLQLAMVHTGFNFINLVFWWTFLPALLKLSRKLFPDTFDSEYWLSSLGVQKLLARIPERAISEAQIELETAVRQLSELTQMALRLLNDTQTKPDKKEDALKAPRSNMNLFERRLNSVEAVIGRVASKSNESSHLNPSLFFLLERVYKINNATKPLATLINHINFNIGIPTLLEKKEIKVTLDAIAVEIESLWDRFYRSFQQEEDIQSPGNCKAQGDLIYKNFFKGKDFRNGIKLQRIYSSILCLRNELHHVTNLSLNVRTTQPAPESGFPLVETNRITLSQ